MKLEAALARVAAHLPTGEPIPAALARLAGVDVRRGGPREPWLEIGWRDVAKDYEMVTKARRAVVPFAHLGDGSSLALWFEVGNSPAVAYLGSGGARQLVAVDLDDFLARARARRTGLPEFDDAPAELDLATTEPSSEDALAARRRAFESFAAEHSALQPPLASVEAERLRRRIVQVAARMVRDGCSKVHTPRSYWSLSFTIARDGTKLVLTYTDCGAAKRVPASYRLQPLIEELVGFVPRRRKTHLLAVTKAGVVSVDRDRSCVIVPKP